jgi:hypothetical protein
MRHKCQQVVSCNSGVVNDCVRQGFFNHGFHCLNRCVAVGQVECDNLALRSGSDHCVPCFFRFPAYAPAGKNDIEAQPGKFDRRSAANTTASPDNECLS